MKYKTNLRYFNFKTIYMIYSKAWFIVSLILLIIFLIWNFLLKKYKVVPLFFPNKWNFTTLSTFQKIIKFLIVLIILIIPLNIWIYQWIKFQKIPTLNIEVLFDVSLSMTAKDILPDRFTMTKKSLIEFIKSLDTNYNIWLIAFSWKPLVRIPFTDEKKAIVWKISHMSMLDFPPTLDFVWTAIWDAIILWWHQLLTYSNKEKRPWVLLLLTDGDSNKWVELSDAIKYAKKHDIIIFVWAIWKNKEYIIWKDRYWITVPTTINLKSLKNIAKSTQWKFMQIKSKEDLLNILSELREYIKTYEITKKIAEYTYINYYLARILAILLILYWFMFIKYNV